MKITLSARQARLLRMRSQQFILSAGPPEPSPTQVIHASFGVQAQDLSAALLGVRARSEHLTAAQVDRARQEDRSLAWVWCMRGTLHLVTAEDARWLTPMLGPALIAADQRRMRQLGWDEDRAARGIGLIQEALAAHGSLTRPEIIQLLAAHGLPSEGQAPIHLLYRAALEGILCRGADRGKEVTFMPFADWIGSAQPLPHEAALGRLAVRYLAAFAPAGPDDLASWSGLPRGEARHAWELIAQEIVSVEIAPMPGRAAQPAWLLKNQLGWLEEPLNAAPAVRLLPRFDNYWLGYASRDLSIDPATPLESLQRLFPGGGIIHPGLLIDGQATGTWSTRRRAAGLEITVEPFQPLSGDVVAQVHDEVKDLGRYLGEKAAVLTLQPPVTG